MVDISARNEATRKAEEERLSKEAEEKKAAEEQAAREAEEKAAEEQAVREAEEKAATEQAAREAEEKAAEEHAAKEAAEKAAAEQPEPEPAPAPQAAEEPVQIAEEQVQEVPVSGTAYLSATGKKYHRIKNCGKMNPDKAIETTVSEAEASGHGRCSKCW